MYKQKVVRYESEGKGEKASGGMGLWGSQSKFVVGSDKIRSAYRKAVRGCRRAVSRTPRCTNMQRGSIVSRNGINVNNLNQGKG